jgi:excinuclease UvrABC ATPase subunit
VVETRAGTDSDVGCDAGSVGARVVTDTTMTAVVTSDASGTGGRLSADKSDDQCREIQGDRPEQRDRRTKRVERGS